MTFDPYNVRPGYWSELAEIDTADAKQALSSLYHSGSALRRVGVLRDALDAARVEAADLLAQLEADQRELARLRALGGL